MSGTSFLLDTNIVLYLLAGDEWLSELLFESILVVSVITEMELLSFKALSEQEDLQIREFLKDCIIIDLDNRVKESAIATRRIHGLKLPDSVVAATGLITGHMLLTADKKLSRVSNLNCFLYEK